MRPEAAAALAPAAGLSAYSRRTTPLCDSALPHSCPGSVRLAVLARSLYFGDLEGAQLDQIDALMQRQIWLPGQNLYTAEDPADGLYVVAKGRIKLFQTRADGTEAITDILGPGEIVGALGTLGEPLRRESAAPLVPTCTLRIAQADFRRVIAQHPQVALRVLDALASQLSLAQSDVRGQGTQSVSTRVATALLRLIDKLGSDQAGKGILIEVPLSRPDLAALARSTTESVSRVMSQWRREGLIDSGRGWVVVLDRERLQRIADATDAG